MIKILTHFIIISYSAGSLSLSMTRIFISQDILSYRQDAIAIQSAFNDFISYLPFGRFTQAINLK